MASDEMNTLERKITSGVICPHLQCIPGVDHTKNGEIVETVPIENEEEPRACVTGQDPVSVVEDSAVHSKGKQYALENGSRDEDSRGGR
jgi:hypothetical protein